MDIDLVDVTVQLQEDISAEQLHGLESALHSLDGVVSTHVPDHNRHLLLVEMNPRRVDADAVLNQLLQRGIHAKLLVPQQL